MESLLFMLNLHTIVVNNILMKLEEKVGKISNHG